MSQVYWRVEFDDEVENHQWCIIQPSWIAVCLRVNPSRPCQSTMSEPEVVGCPCLTSTVHLRHSPVCQRLERLLVFSSSLTLSELNWKKMIFLLQLAQGFMFSIKFVSNEAQCVKWVSTRRVQRTSPMADIFIMKIDWRKWWRTNVLKFFPHFSETEVWWLLYIDIVCTITLSRRG